jgi:regulator of chromosome condensation
VAALAALLRDVADIGCGYYTTFAISKRGELAAWGLNNTGQLGLPVKVEHGAGPAAAAAAAAAAAGEEQANGGAAEGPVNHAVWEPTAVESVPGDVTAVAGGEHHTLFVSRARGVLSCGRTLYGMLGRAAAADLNSVLPVPAAVDGSDGFGEEAPASAAAGQNVSACVTAQVGWRARWRWW